MLGSIKNYIYRKRLQRGLQKRATPDRKSLVNLKNAKAVGILFDAQKPDESSQVVKYAEKLRKTGKKVQLLAYVGEQAALDSFPFDAYNHKNIDWAGCPKSDRISEFINQRFDLLLHISCTSNPHASFISALSNAQLRVGPSIENIDCYDLMIGASPSAGINKFVQQMEAVLDKTNLQHEAT
jgi:hypothetical protein